MSAQRLQETEWRKATDAHAWRAMWLLVSRSRVAQTNTRLGPVMGGSVTIEIEGPDGIWRRYYVRLTEVNP